VPNFVAPLLFWGSAN